MGDEPETARRARLAEIDRDLTRLRYRHDIAMSAFRFEEATALGPAISTLEQERQRLAAAIPDVEPPTGIVPVLAHPGDAAERRQRPFWDGRLGTAGVPPDAGRRPAVH